MGTLGLGAETVGEGFRGCELGGVGRAVGRRKEEGKGVKFWGLRGRMDEGKGWLVRVRIV